MPKKTTAIAKFSFEVAVVEALDAKYGDIVIKDGNSYKTVMEGLAAYRDIRLVVDDEHKLLKSGILEAGRGIDKDWNRIKEHIQPGEDGLKAKRKVWDDKKAAIKEAKAQKERDRVEVIRAKIDKIDLKTIEAQGKTSDQIIDMQLELEDIVITKEEYQELTYQAKAILRETMESLSRAYKDRLKSEKEDAARKAESERLETIRKEQAAKEAELKKERDKLEADKRAEEDKKSREKLEKNLKEQAERDAKAKVELENKEKKDKAEAEEAERKEREAALPDKRKLIIFADSLQEIIVPDVISDLAQDLAAEVRGSLVGLSKEIRMKAQKL